MIPSVDDFKCIHVKRDDIFINNMVKKLQEFYEKYFKSAVLQRLFYKEYSKYSGKNIQNPKRTFKCY
jgi:hypothetical protein